MSFSARLLSHQLEKSSTLSVEEQDKELYVINSSDEEDGWPELSQGTSGAFISVLNSTTDFIKHEVTAPNVENIRHPVQDTEAGDQSGDTVLPTAISSPPSSSQVSVSVVDSELKQEKELVVIASSEDEDDGWTPMSQTSSKALISHFDSTVSSIKQKLNLIKTLSAAPSSEQPTPSGGQQCDGQQRGEGDPHNGPAQSPGQWVGAQCAESVQGPPVYDQDVLPELTVLPDSEGVFSQGENKENETPSRQVCLSSLSSLTYHSLSCSGAIVRSRCCSDWL